MSTQEAFEDWFEHWRASTWKPLPSDARQDLPKHWAMNAQNPMRIAWQACQAHNDTVIAELVEALKLARPSIHLSCAKHKIETVIEKQDYLKTLYEYDKKLLDKIEELIAKHKGQS